MKNLHDGLGEKEMSDLVLIETHDKNERKNLTQNETKKISLD